MEIKQTNKWLENIILEILEKSINLHQKQKVVELVESKFKNVLIVKSFT